MSRAHYEVHRRVRQLRQFLHLCVSGCDRCERVESSIRVSAPSRVVDEQPVRKRLDLANNSIVDLYSRAYPASLARPLPTTQGINRSFFQYENARSLERQLTEDKQRILEEARKETLHE